jgi:two-component system KDP operon response regulator KdpE
LIVLLIEDEPQMRHFLRAALGGDDYQLIEAATGREGLAQAAGRKPDLILLDLGLPDTDGLTVTRHIREWTATPIIVISARGQERDKIAALDAGADDYLTKPFSVPELLARMRVAVRHALAIGGPAEPVFEAGGLRVDIAQRRVFRNQEEVHLTPNEHRLLQVLVRHAGKVLTHRQLLKEAWGAGATDQIHNLRVYMNQLRQKLEEDPTRPRLLVTELGVGYRLKPD